MYNGNLNELVEKFLIQVSENHTI